MIGASNPVRSSLVLFRLFDQQQAQYIALKIYDI
jgi:hypothetical protein